MKGRATLYLALIGTVALAVGIVTVVALLIHRMNCDGVSPVQVCQGYTNSIPWALPALAVGAGCLVEAGFAGTRRASARADDSKPQMENEDLPSG